jgi:hypothetical protein
MCPNSKFKLKQTWNELISNKRFNFPAVFQFINAWLGLYSPCGEHLSQVSLKSFHQFTSYKAGTNQSHDICAKFEILQSDKVTERTQTANGQMDGY